MYRIKNFLFGWDYISWCNGVDYGIARVMKLDDGKVIYWRYKLTNVLDEIKDKDEVYWLTCHPSKYLTN